MPNLTATEYVLAETLLDVLGQACAVERATGEECIIVDHDCLSAFEDACDVLARMGLAEPTFEGSREYRLLWKNLGPSPEEV